MILYIATMVTAAIGGRSDCRERDFGSLNWWNWRSCCQEHVGEVKLGALPDPNMGRNAPKAQLPFRLPRLTGCEVEGGHNSRDMRFQVQDGVLLWRL